MTTSDRFRHPGPALALFLAGLTLAAAVQAQAPDAAPQKAPRTVRQRLAPCHLPGLEEALCGTYPVWENRVTKSGRKIPLNIIVLPAKSPDPAPDPIFELAGGPGQGATEGAAELAEVYGGLRSQRDVVLVDTRGTGRSNPLNCALPGSADDLQGYLHDLFPLDALRACVKKLDADPALYTSETAMDDLDEVRAWLGYERINLSAGSYGTRAAEVYLRRHPEHARSALLIGYVPLEARMPFYMARQSQIALDKVFDDCAAAPACRAAFPDPKGELAAVLARFEKGPARDTLVHPKTGKPVELTLSKSSFTTTLRSMQYSPTLYTKLPLYLHRAFLGDWAPFLRQAVGYFDDPSWAIGLYLSVTCAEDVARIDPAAVAREAAGTYLGDDRVRQQRAACAFWPAAKLSPEFWEPRQIPTPVLLVSGWLDPATPPEWAAAAKGTFPNSANLLLREGAHGPGGLSHPECILRIIEDFFANGTAIGLDTSCAREMKRPAFALALPAAPAPPAVP
ncbi:MAG TPA: alpha/beta fold hydrolase [Thermoanaerobaculia bacterium]|nr:alpha/beta fold hydrolase [Thermoanaerobaculia bacterium]